MIRNLTTKSWIIWDNDGVLCDTEKVFFEATRDALHTLGIELDDDLYRAVSLREGKSVIEHLLALDPGQAEHVSNLRESLYRERLLGQSHVTQEVEKIVSALASRYTMGVVTGSSPDIMKILYRDSTLLKNFSFLVTSADYSHPKPDPEPYLVAIERYNIRPDEAIVIEDSLRGYTSAMKAGLECILLKNELLEIPGSLNAPVISSITELENLL